MPLITGLGNPGEKYRNTRHNAGFKLIDKLAKTKELTRINQKSLGFKKENSLKAKIAKTHFKEEDVILAKPLTYMNKSGNAVKKIKGKFELKLKDIWIAMDDIDLPVGTIRFRDKGSSGGHKGLENIIKKLNSQKFARIKIGISPLKGFNERTPVLKDPIKTKEFVLSKFSKKETKLVEKAIDTGIQHILESLKKKSGFIATTLDVS